ncbi:MAG: hypothetical protein WC749_12795, partial [Dehalococcoidia bacterium]
TSPPPVRASEPIAPSQPPPPAAPTPSAPPKAKGGGKGVLWAVAAVVIIGVVVALALVLAGGGDGGGGGLYSLDRANISANTWNHPDIDLSARVPAGWQASDHSDYALFTGKDITNPHESVKLIVERAPDDLMSAVRSSGSEVSPRSVLNEYLDDNIRGRSTVQVKIGSLGTTSIENQQRAGVTVQSHVVGMLNVDGSSIWDMEAYEVIMVGNEWWLVTWISPLNSWDENSPYLKTVSDSLRILPQAVAAPSPTAGAQTRTATPTSQPKTEALPSGTLMATGTGNLQEFYRPQIEGAGLQIKGIKENTNTLKLTFPADGGPVTGHLSINQTWEIYNPDDGKTVVAYIIMEADMSGNYSRGGGLSGTVDYNMTLQKKGEADKQSFPTKDEPWSASLDGSGNIRGQFDNTKMSFTARLSK